jgi:hypothetical protein
MLHIQMLKYSCLRSLIQESSQASKNHDGPRHETVIKFCLTEGERNEMKNHTLVILSGLLSIVAPLAFAQGGLVNSTKNPLQIALLHWNKS